MLHIMGYHECGSVSALGISQYLIGNQWKESNYSLDEIYFNPNTCKMQHNLKITQNYLTYLEVKRYRN